ncbi:50S ribosomal protein L24e [Candidatus Woesearchaeota archaeon]|jgi:large subunit ribosomal protein L24e|nr:50S ribosomal protein L24e [Candidatus Woesearchaeota archaeon]|tara:strand:+ start:252 stop:482 length:231 start_codon:yes stop_codon:yes gene_type:complete
MARCSFCGNTIAIGTGTLYVKNDGRMFSFCSRKCIQHLQKLKRQPRHTSWTRTARREKAAPKDAKAAPKAAKVEKK